MGLEWLQETSSQIEGKSDDSRRIQLFVRTERISRLAIVPDRWRKYGLWITNPQEAEALGRSGLADFMAGSPAPTAGESIEAKRTFANGNNLSHQQTDHAIKKTGGLNFGDQQISLASEAHVLNGCAGMGTATSRPLKCCKIMLANNVGKGSCHQVLVKMYLMAVPTPRRQKKIRQTSIIDRISVATILCIVASMPCAGNFGRSTDANRLGQATIEGGRPTMGRNWAS